MKTTNTIKNFAKRMVMAIAVMLMAGNVWGASVSISTSAKTFPAGSTTVNDGAWKAAASQNQGYWSGDKSFGTLGSLLFTDAGDQNNAYKCQMNAGSGVITTTITSSYGVDVTVSAKVKSGGSMTISITTPSGTDSKTCTGTDFDTYMVSTTSTSATLTISNTGTKTSGVQYITITPKEGSSCTGDALEMTTVTATPGDKQVTLSWDAVTGATKYQVKWGSAAWADVNTNSYTKTGLTNGDEYTYQVKAIGNGTTTCDSDPTDAATVKPGLCYKVSFSTGEDNPEVASKTESEYGDGITLPAGPTPNASGDGWVFAGWGTAEVSNVTVAPRLYMPNDYYYPEGNETLYAVYRKLTSGTSTATFTSTNLDNLTQLSEDTSKPAWWIHTATGVEFYINSWGIYDSNGDKFNIYSSWALIDAHTKIQQVEFSIYNSKTISSVELSDAEEEAGGTAELSGSSKQTVTCSGDVTQLYLYKSSGDAYFTTFTVTYYNAKYHSNPVPCAVNPTVGNIMNAVSAISSTGATFSTSAGVSAGTGCDLTAVGFVYGTATVPTLDNNVASIDNYTSGVLNKSITGLTPNTKYYVRAYATNSHGTTYSDEKEFTTLQRYNITYNNNGGSGSMDGSTKDHGADFTLPANAGTMTKTGYHIANWRLGSASGTSYSLGDTYDGNAAAEFYAGWEPNTFSVAFNKNGGQGDAMTNQAFTYDAAQNLSANTYTPAAGSHKYFAGWATSSSRANAGTVDYADKASVSNLTPTNNGTYTLYAVWKDHTYTNYRTSCCTELGTVGGAVEFTDPTTAVVTWNDMSNVAASDPYAVTYRTGSDDFGSTNVGEITTNNITGKKECTITGLSCNTAYDFQIEVTAATGYCDKSEILEDQNSGKWDLDYDLTGVSLKEGDLEEGDGVLCGDLSVTFELLSEAYELPDDVVVEIGGVTKTNGTDYLWDENDGTLVIYKTEIDGKVEIKVEATLVGCSANPTVASAGLKAAGIFNLGQVDVETSGWSTGANTCAWTDYGFVWSTSANPALNADGTAPDGVNKVVVGTDGNATSWNGSLTGTFEAGVTYYFRAYGKNSKNEANYAYSAVNGTFTPRSVTYNSNGGSVIATVYVNNGRTVSAPTAPTRDGYTFSGWKLSGSAYDFTTAVNGNITLDAVWTANEYTVTISKNYTNTSQNYTATYGADMPDMKDFTNFTRKGYALVGIFANNDGTGTMYYDENKTSAHVWDQAEDATIYAHWSPKNYTITLNNEGADEGHEGTASISVTYDANTNLTEAITIPVKDGYVFSGYYTEAAGEGVQIIDADGYVIENASNYTGDGRIWKKAGDVELHAYWRPIYTVTWSVNGTETPEQVIKGEKVAAMPTAPTSSDCDDAKKFVGWRAEAIEGVSATAPSGIFTDVAGSPEITDDITFYAVFATETIGQSVTLSFPDDNSEHNGLTSAQYTSTWTAMSGDYSWSISNFNNNNWLQDWAYIKCGRKTYASTGTITTSSAIGFPVDTVIVSIGGITASSVNSAKLYISSASNFETKASMDIEQSTGVKKLVIASPAKDMYYQIEYDCASASSNGIVQIDAITYKQKTVWSGYVTTCASCDADATFTNTLPAISAEDCTSATVTATGGLATLGSEGCNISDYGFVLSTATNPELDGEGVTKLQVGTSNPTVGNDFSYEMTGLTKGTHYYVRAYAVNKHGVAYSSTKDFWTKDVSSIAITTAPTKTNYIVGETFDATGMVVTATLADGSEVDVTEDVTYSPSAFNAAGNVDFPVNYSLCETNVQTTQPINVYSVTVNEGMDPSKGDMTYDNAGTITISNLASHTTVEFVKENAEVHDNGDGTFSIINPTGTVSITVNYVTAVEVDVKFFANGTPLTDLALNPYQSENFDMPDASAVANAMTAAGVSVSDDVHFVGWSANEFPYQTIEPTMVAETGKVTAATNYYAVFSNIQKVRIDEGVIPGSYQSSETEVTAGGFTFVHKQVMKNATTRLQFKKDNGYVYNKTAISNIVRIEVGAPGGTYQGNVPVYACSAKKTISGSALVDEDTADDRYIYLFPANTQYFWVKGNDDTYNVDYIDIYYAQGTAYYTTQFSTLTFNKADGTTDKTEKVATGKTRTLSADDAPAAVAGYTFMEKWSDGANDYVAGDGLTVNADMTLNPYSSLTTGADVDINDLPATVTEIVVTDGKTLTVDENRTLDNLTVEAGGKVSGSNNLTVINNLLIKTSLGTISGDETNTNGKSGEITNGNNIVANGDVFLEIELTQDAEASYGWYAFSVPFPVDAMNGIYYGNTKLTNEDGYAIMSYHGKVRAQGQYAWKKYRGIMQPGVLYIIAVGDTDYKTLRFKKVADAALVANESVAVKKYASETGNDKDGGWNGIGNPNLQISYYGSGYLHFLDHDDNAFKSRTGSNINLVVGSAFFIQYSGNEDGSVVINKGTQNNANGYLAPARERQPIENVIHEVRLYKGDKEEDNVFLTTSEEATNNYEIGKDVAKLSMGEAKCAQMMIPAYGTNLCAADFPLVNGQAEYPLTITAPAAGSYRIEAAEAYEGATLYLTRDGRAIWNLSMSACEVELTKGTTENYGLLLVRKAPGVATGNLTPTLSQGEGAKILIDEHVYILRGGQMYDVTGKAVK